MTNTHEAPAPFPSLAAMRARHTDLLRSLPARGLEQRQVQLVNEFLERGRDTGVVLDVPSDREAAQGLLDYWKATLYTQRGPSEQGASPGRVPASVLADYNAAAVQKVVDRAEASVGALLEEDPAFEGAARCILMRLVRLPEEGVVFAPVPAGRS